MSSPYFSDLLPQLAERSKLATIGQLGFANVPLRRHLAEIFSRPFGETGCFLGDPTFEAVFGWAAAQSTMAELAGNLLSKQLVNAMHNPPQDLAEDYAFKKEWHPYQHQLEAWKILSRTMPQSLVVASGTGSGKTECFMVPILDRLIREQAETQQQLVGVRALFLYPLNALINSQRERLRAWTHEFEDQIRFSLYNGNTPEKEPAHKHRECPNETIDREALRTSPPPILVTNSTMLEYMLVRTVDAPILQKSQGKLEWVVLDEAHSYIGSQAAELSLLIRRVLFAFGVKAEQVRFVATSATIGDPNGEAGQKLRRFLADVAGVNLESVHLVAGSREVPHLNDIATGSNLQSLNELCNIDSEGECSAAVSSHPVARKLRNLFIKDHSKFVARLSEVSAALGVDTPDRSSQQQALRWLDLLSGTKMDDGTSFLPLRAHFFHQTLTGLWACADQECPKRVDSALDHEQWCFGKVYLEPRKHCICGSPVYEIVSCDDCGAVYLQAELTVDDRLLHLHGPGVIDEFELESDAVEENVESSDNDDSDEEEISRQADLILITNRRLSRTGDMDLVRTSRKIADQSSEHTVRIIAHEVIKDQMGCLVCKGSDTYKKKLFQTGRVGAPFLLGNALPTLLEFAPDGVKPAEHPYRGRRLLTFNDSRQGTARIAARLQQDSERSRVRGLVYHLALQNHQRQTAETETVRDLKSTLNIPGLPAEAVKSIKALLAKEVASYQPLGFDELARQLASQGRDFERILTTYRGFDSDTFGGPAGHLELARMLLVREFGRRPKRSNNLETMGIVAVRYPALDQVSVLPEAAKRAKFSIEDWRDFLKICLDFVVRSGCSLAIEQSWRNWLGMPFPQKWLVDRDLEDINKFKQRRWPRAKRSGPQSTLVKLLTYTLKVDIENPYGEDLVDDLLFAAWEELKRKILQQTDNGCILPLNGLAFMPIETAWVCPVTRRILDTTLRGITPYLPRNSTDSTALCEQITIPLYDVPFGGEDDELQRIRRARSWISRQDFLGTLREEGLWNNLNDRVIELAPYFTTAEHSAQQESSLLGRYEKDFKSGDLNLLSCSTTMEMGIDIGGISMVAMNNVPPHPANYLQRAGRAGRRKEAQSVAFTLCKSNPHDQSVFRNSRWAFDTQLPAPKVSLDSKVIVQRHVNSMLLAYFLANTVDSQQERTKLTCAWFFADASSPVENFIAWCGNFEPKILPRLVGGLEQLVRHSVFEGCALSSLFQQSAQEIGKIQKAWQTEWVELCRQETGIAASGKSEPAFKAIQNHKKRMGDEYLLRELATQGFLPGYGFPTHIVTLDKMTVSEFKRERKEKKGREDNRYQRRELPSRDRVTALREYAPGAEVVIDGRVYRSAGITLNWHIPATEKETREIQNIKFAWRCQHCGASGSWRTLSSKQICDSCGIAIEEHCEFLEPAGFSVDFYDDPDNDVTTQDFIPVEQPWINAQGDWTDLPNSELGRFRMTPDGHIFHQSRGIHGNGYAICLTCGRTEPLTHENKAGKLDRPHRKLRVSSDCPGSYDPWKIKRITALGHEERTDVFELQLKRGDGVWLSDKKPALTIAVAIRDALAELLGVQASELGCGIKQAKSADESICQSILVYDRFAAGYSSSCKDFLAQLLKLAAEKLNCPAQCDSVCPQCILDFDQRFEAEYLDRRAALQILRTRKIITC